MLYYRCMNTQSGWSPRKNSFMYLEIALPAHPMAGHCSSPSQLAESQGTHEQQARTKADSFEAIFELV